MKRRIRIGTRGSKLALWQAEFVKNALHGHTEGRGTELIIISTEGDRDQTSSLTRIGGLGVFTKAIEEALLENRIDIAVHSLKDLPSALHDDLLLAAVPERGAVEDVLITADGCPPDELRYGASIATGSIRRRSQLLHLRPDLKITDLRGNIETRLNKLKNGDSEGIIMALAALKRLKIETIRYYPFSVAQMIPAVGQGAIGLEIRTNDQEMQDLAAVINHGPSFACITAERSLLRTLDSGCQFPVGACAQLENGGITLRGFVGSEDGRQILIEEQTGPADAAGILGQRLAEKLIGRGAHKILSGEDA